MYLCIFEYCIYKIIYLFLIYLLFMYLFINQLIIYLFIYYLLHLSCQNLINRHHYAYTILVAFPSYCLHNQFNHFTLTKLVGHSTIVRPFYVNNLALHCSAWILLVVDGVITAPILAFIMTTRKHRLLATWF